jgi:hypothetical protein
VLILSVDGLHAQDLERMISSKPFSAMAKLAGAGVRYTKAMAPFPSDSFPSVLAQMTGGTPKSTGILYDISYDRSLSPAGSNCEATGAKVDFSEAANRDPKALDGGGGFDDAKLPRDPARGCVPVLPHEYLRVNTLFEVVKAAGGRTAWSDKHLSYDVLNGPSGKGVDDLYDPDIAAKGLTKSIPLTEQYDDGKVDVILKQIIGQDHMGATAAVPMLFGMDFQAVSVAQKLATAGYMDSQATPSAMLQGALDHTDASLARILAALDTAKLRVSTTVILTGTHGQSPIDPAARRVINTRVIPTLVEQVQMGLVASVTQDAVALVWLTDHTKAEAAALNLEQHKMDAGVDHVLRGAALADMFGDPAQEPRAPDLAVIVQEGVIYADSAKGGEHGGFSDDDRHVALVVAAPGAGSKTVDDGVETRQVAPTVLQALGLDPAKLDSVKAEGTHPLP